MQAAVEAEGRTGADPLRNRMKDRFKELRDEHATALGLPQPRPTRTRPQAADRGADNGTSRNGGPHTAR
ncbi:MAG: hypothetical protein ACRDPW_05410 [Mycobacteriales bacterium]